MMVLLSRYVLCMSIVTAIYCKAVLPDEKLFLQGNMLYEQGHYQQAYDTYMKIENKGYAVYFNLGNCAYHLTTYPQAYAFWLRAQYDAPFSVQSLLEHKYTLLAALYGERQFTQSLLQQIVVRISPLLVQILAIVLWAIFWWLIIRGYWKRCTVRCILIGILAIVCCALAVLHYTIFSKNYAVTQCKITVYAGPNEQYHILGDIDPMCKISVEDSYENWYRIRFNTSAGWILNRDVIRV